jgi:hypothetical protein
MAQDLTVNIKTTSDVPQAMDKAKQATTGFGKQVEDIQKKFSTSFKDIFLSFLGPMALLGTAIGLIGKMISDIQQKQEDANQAAINGTNALMSAEDKYWANKRKNEKKSAKDTEEANLVREETTRQFIIFERDRAFEAMSETQKASFLSGSRMDEFVKDPQFQKKIQALIEKDRLADPATKLEEAQRKEKEEAERIKKEQADAKAAASKKEATQMTIPGSVSGNVIGVGANPVVTALQEQQLVAREQLAVLQVIASNGMQGPARDVTASGATPSTPANASPSRAALLTKNK